MSLAFREEIFAYTYDVLAELAGDGCPGPAEEITKMGLATAALVEYIKGRIHPVVLLEEVGKINRLCLVYAGTECFDISFGPEACAGAFFAAVERRAAALREVQEQ